MWGGGTTGNSLDLHEAHVPVLARMGPFPPSPHSRGDASNKDYTLPHKANNANHKTTVVDNASYKNLPSTSETNNPAISPEKQKAIDEMMSRTIFLKSGRRELNNFHKSKPYQLKIRNNQSGWDEVERIQMAEEGLRILTRTLIFQIIKLPNLSELGGKPVTDIFYR